jgi:hypothetical protein
MDGAKLKYGDGGLTEVWRGRREEVQERRRREGP